MRGLGDGATRRGLVGGALAAGLTHALNGRAASAAARARTAPCTPKAPGVRTTGLAVTRDGRTAWSTDNASTTITSHRGRKLARHRSIDVGGAPCDITLTRDDRFALVTTAFYDRPGLSIVDLRTGDISRVRVGPEPAKVAHREHMAWVTGGGAKGTLTPVHLKTGRAGRPIAVGRHPHGVAVDRHGRHAVVALNGQSAVALVTLATRKVRLIPTSARPYGVALSQDGTRALVTHNGFGDHQITPIDVVRGRAGRSVKVGTEPLGVAYTRSGRRAVVALDGAVAVVDGRTGRRRRTVKQPHRPRSVAVAGRHAIVSDWLTGDLRRIRI